jgi:D-alanine-D-alanine ligase
MHDNQAEQKDMRKVIAVVMGGFSSERVISLKSGQQVFQNIDTAHFEPFLVDISTEGWHVLVDGEKIQVDKTDFSFMLYSEKKKFEAVFMAIHGEPGENGILQGYFELMGVPYTTAPALQMALTFEKAWCNKVLASYGVQVPPSYIFRKNDKYNLDEIAAKFGFPLFVKPSQAGSSFGVSKVKSMADFQKAIDHAFEFADLTIVERAIVGREVTCGVVDFWGEAIALPLTEIISHNEFFDFQAKYEGASDEVTPAQMDEKLVKRVQAAAVEAYTILGMRGMTRIDFIVENETPYLIELNTVPGMSEASIVPQQARAAGYDLKDFYSAALWSAINRKD